jgi:phosphoenolpyruvate carboxykinase (diphosphate)
MASKNDSSFADTLGFTRHLSADERQLQRTALLSYVNLKLAAHGQPIATSAEGMDIVSLAQGLLANFDEKTRLLEHYRCPVDRRIEEFLNHHFRDVLGESEALRLPGRTLILDRHGIARVLSLPAKGDVFQSDILTSYRVSNGVLHNPRSDKRTTGGTFHVVAGGLPVPADKREVPRHTFVKLFQLAMHPPDDLLTLPFTAEQPEQARTWLSLLLRPAVCPEVAGYCERLSMETRFFAPGTLASNLDFVESIFGNAGDPYLTENDAALDVEHWSGHTGCVILATHLQGVRKIDVGLPHLSEASERQKADGMCWSTEDDRYNEGEAFKLACRTEDGVIVTIIADNYYGYCKKEVKTQISYAANLMGNVEEEHAGGALVFGSFSLGETFQANSRAYNGRTFDDVVRDYGAWMTTDDRGFATDRLFPHLLYVPENALADLREQRVSWTRNGVSHSIPLLPDRVYMAPSGYKLRMEKHPAAPSWRLIGTSGEGLFCHKPCTVSGGGKSEISKPINDYMQYGPVFVSHFPDDAAAIDELLARDYMARWRPEVLAAQRYDRFPSRPILSPQRSLGSVIKLLTPSEEYTDEYNAWLRSLPSHLLGLVFAIKRFYAPSWTDDWRAHFSVDTVNGDLGHELKLHARKLVGTYLRVGLSGDHGWRTFKVRQDFIASLKVQMEDDISVSVVVPGPRLPTLPDYLTKWQGPSFKFVENCEYRLFQRPDDAVHRGLDKQAEADLARRDVNFISNFEPLSRAQVHDMLEKVVDFDAFTEPVKDLLRAVEHGESGYVVCSANPRRVGGVPTKNPRYLQDRPDMADPFPRHLADMGARLWRAVPPHQAVLFPVGAVLSGRRNNPPDRAAGIRSLAVYNPIHYQELPELFMDYICSLTGKSPSTTAAGSEGALTKGPFNALRTAADLNAALVSMILTGLHGFSTAAGHIGPTHRFDHDISLLVPEIWARISPAERDPQYLMRERLLEPVEDVIVDGETVPARRLGYRITNRFVRRYFGRVFDNPDKVFDDSILKPETQDPDAYVDGVKYIMEAYERVGRQYFDDGTIDECCPPIQAVLHIMAHGQYEGRDERDPSIREMFTREHLIASDWYRMRLRTRQVRDISLWQRHVRSLEESLANSVHAKPTWTVELARRRAHAASTLAKVQAPEYLASLEGTIGAQPSPGLSADHAASIAKGTP